MEFEQIVKQLEFIDAERRKDKAAIEELKEQLASSDGTINALSKQVKKLNKELSEFSTSAARLNQFDTMMANQRNDFNAAVTAVDKKHEKREKESGKRLQAENDELRRSLLEIRSALEGLNVPGLMQTRQSEEARLNQAITELKGRIEDAIRSNEDAMRGQKLIEEARRQDMKRVADTQGELTALRKRIDDQREKTDLNSDSLRNIETRINEVVRAEADRKAGQVAFIEQQNIAQIDRERAWKEWRDKYEEFKKQAQGFDTQVAALDESIRSAKRAQDTYQDLNQRLERRINEITEMQRLAEDRLRQEWVTFKADDQKRWTGYSLSAEESMRDIRRDVDKVKERMDNIEDATQSMSDQMVQTTDVTQQQLQELMNWAHEWLTSYERIMGKPKR
jgi:chromosome segregation ATPase